MRRQRGRYELLDVIGHGAAGVVHLARDRHRRRYVAAKVLASAGEDDLAQHRFLNEQRVTVEHPHLLTPLDWYQTPEAAVLVMELADAGSMEDVLASNPVLTPNFVEQIADQALKGLHALHEAGVIHRDIKPANLMLTRSGAGVELKLGDFGISMVEGAPRLTQDMSVLGTLGYVAPEVLAGGAYSVRSDLWSLGRTLSVIAERCEPGISRRLADVLGAMTADDPADRPSGAADALERLDAAVDTDALRITAVPERVAGSIRRDVRRRRTKHLAVGLAAALIVSSGGVLVRAAAMSEEAPEPAWRIQRKANMAAGRVDCLTFGDSATKPRRMNIFPPQADTRWYTTGRPWEHSLLISLHSSEDPIAKRPTQRIGRFDVARGPSPGFATFEHARRSWTVGVTDIGLTELAEGDLDAVAVDFVSAIRPDGDELAVGVAYGQVGLPRPGFSPIWSITSQSQGTISAYAGDEELLSHQPGRRAEVLGRPAIVNRTGIYWSETANTLIVLETREVGMTLDIDDPDRFASILVAAAEDLRPCTARQYAALEPDLDRNAELVVEADGSPDDRWIHWSDAVPPQGESAGTGSGQIGSEGLAISRSLPEATGVWLWSSPQSSGGGTRPSCAQFEVYPREGEPPRRVKFTGCDTTPADWSVTPSLACTAGSTAFRVSPGMSDVARPSTITFGSPRWQSECDDTTGTGITSVTIVSATLRSESFGCRPAPNTTARGTGVLRWSDGTTSDARFELDVTAGFKLQIEVTTGHFAGHVGKVDTSPYPFEGECASGGITRGLLVLESLRFVAAP